MKHSFSPDRKQLFITCSPEEQAEMRETLEANQSEYFRQVFAFLEPLIANSELHWINPEDTGDLTNAPMLGILGEPVPDFQKPTVKCLGWVHVGSWPFPGHKKPSPHFQPILERWAFMEYETTCILETLMEKGSIVFVS